MSEFTLGWLFVAGDSALHRINKNTFHRLAGPQTSPACDSYTADSHSNDRSFKLSTTYDTRRRLTINRCVHKRKIKSQKLMILFIIILKNYKLANCLFLDTVVSVFANETSLSRAWLGSAWDLLCNSSWFHQLGEKSSRTCQGLELVCFHPAETKIPLIYCCVKIRLALSWCWWGLRIRRSGKLQFFG